MQGIMTPMLGFLWSPRMKKETYRALAACGFSSPPLLQKLT